MEDPEAEAGGPRGDPPKLPAPAPAAWSHRHLLDLDVLSWPDIELVMSTAEAMRDVLDRPIPKVPALRGMSATILFYEASTRTRVSFEVAAKNLSADVVNVAASTSSVAKGESLVDTVRTVDALEGIGPFAQRVEVLGRHRTEHGPAFVHQHERHPRGPVACTRQRDRGPGLLRHRRSLRRPRDRADEVIG